MPITRISGKLVCFLHVPRCGGTSMEHYLVARFGPLAFRDPRYLEQPGPARWTRTAPQHVAAADLERLFPPGFLDESFAIVRDPLARQTSVFRFQRDVEERISRGRSFEAWLDNQVEKMAQQRFVLDNHVRPMTEMVPEGARIFHLEQGMDPVIAWLDALAGDTAPEVVLKEKNNYAKRLDWAGIEPGPAPVITDHVRAILAEVYAGDYDRFGYAPDTAEDGPRGGGGRGGQSDTASDKPSDTPPDTSSDTQAAKNPATQP